MYWISSYRQFQGAFILYKKWHNYIWDKNLITCIAMKFVDSSVHLDMLSNNILIQHYLIKHYEVRIKYEILGSCTVCCTTYLKEWSKLSGSSYDRELYFCLFPLWNMVNMAVHCIIQKINGGKIKCYTLISMNFFTKCQNTLVFCILITLTLKI